MLTRARIFAASAVLGLGSLLAMPAPPAQAVGCLSGAAAGAVAGHYAGHHAVAGAIGGCIVGHHMRKVQRRNAAAHQTPMPSGTPQPN